MFFFFNDTATTEIYTLSLHDALPIFDMSKEPANVLDMYGAKPGDGSFASNCLLARRLAERGVRFIQVDRKSTRLNSSHANISYAVFCLKKKKKNITDDYVNAIIYEHR